MTDFTLLVKRLMPTIRRISYRASKGFSYFDHEDLFQEALIYLWNSHLSGKLEDKTDSYMLQGCYFNLKNYIRTHSRNTKAVSFESLVGEDGDILENVLSLSREQPKAYLEYFHNKFLVDTIRNNGLSTREKEVLFLYAEGLTTREIGARLGVSHVSVVKIMGRAKEKCKKHLD